MKPSLEELKAARDTMTWDERTFNSGDKWLIVPAPVASEMKVWLDAQIAEEEREAKAKEWPQDGDKVWGLDLQGTMFESTFGAGWNGRALAMGMLYRTRAEAELVRDFLRSRPRGWLLAMAKMGEGTAFTNTVGRLSMLWHADKWNALTDDERAALLGQG